MAGVLFAALLRSEEPAKTTDEARRQQEELNAQAARRAREGRTQWELNEKETVREETRMRTSKTTVDSNESKPGGSGTKVFVRQKTQSETYEDGHVWHSSTWLGWISVHVSLPDTYQVSEVRMKLGDDPNWARKDWNDRDWEEIADKGIPSRAGIFWVRYRVRGPGQLPAGIYHKVCAAYDLFWDGRLIGHSGVPANNRREEVPGKLDRTFGLPDEWRGAGEHVVALRMSSYLVGFPGPRTDLQVWFSTPENQALNISQGAIQPALAEGAMLMIAVTSLVMWSVAARRATLLLFVGLCLCAAATQALTVQRFAYSYTYDYHYPARLTAMYASGAMCVCLLAFVGLHFGVPRWQWLVAMFVSVFVALVVNSLAAGISLLAFVGLLFGLLRWRGWIVRVLTGLIGSALIVGGLVVAQRVPSSFYLPLGEKSGLVVTIGLGVSLIATGWAYWQQRTGAWAVAAGTLLSVVGAWHARGGLMEGSAFFPIFLPLVLGLAVAVALRLRLERQQAHATQLATARLETELLKKNLQPHFLLNTLTALSEVVEQDPPGAVSLINDLAGEFRSLTRMSGEKCVPLGQELDLCRAHLRVMSVRTKVAWSLDVAGVDESASVPPAMFLTLIENGFAHQRVSGSAGIFVLRMLPQGGGVTRYTFLAPGEVRAEPSRAPGGTGLRYVRARLEESFPGAWTLTQRKVPEGWETVIELRASGEKIGRAP